MNHNHELGSMGKSPHHSELETTNDQRDAQVLARLGKKSVLEVGIPIAPSERLC